MAISKQNLEKQDKAAAKRLAAETKTTTPAATTIIKRTPHHIITLWKHIFSFQPPTEKQYISLHNKVGDGSCVQIFGIRFLCRCFRDAIQPPPIWTFFPHRSTPVDPLRSLSIDSFFRHISRSTLRKKDLPKLVFLASSDDSTFPCCLDKTRIKIEWPVKIFGSGIHETKIHGGFLIKGPKSSSLLSNSKKGKKSFSIVELYDMTVTNSNRSGHGLWADQGLDFTCTRMNFTNLGDHGVYAYNTKGRLLNCTITKCGMSGIQSSSDAWIEVEGSETKVEGNVTKGNGSGFGLNASESVIYLLSPLTQESVSINNCRGKNYGSSFGGKIETVASFNESFESLKQKYDDKVEKEKESGKKQKTLSNKK